MTQSDPRWLESARAYLGTREYPGAATNPVIALFWKMAKLSGIKDDAVPWCSGFACAMVEAAGIRSPRSDSAKAWLTWGKPLISPKLGAIAVFKRPGGWHVGVVVGRDGRGNLMILGGNQGDAVSIASFPSDRLVGLRYPQGLEADTMAPIMAGIQESRSEA